MRRFATRKPMLALTAVGLLCVSAAFVAAQVPGPKPTDDDARTANIVAKLLEAGHLSNPKIDDDLSEQWLKNYFEMLDPLKYYFTAADVKEFSKYRDRLDDLILDDTTKQADLAVAKQIFDRFLERSDERLEDATAIIAEKPDFAVEETIVDDPDRLDWPADREEARDRLRKIIKLELLQKKIDQEDEAKTIRQLGVRYRDRNRYYKLFDMSDLLEVYLSALTTSVDPHSNYMSSKTLEDMINQSLHLSLEGIGASLMMEDGIPVVKEIVPGGAADKDGRLKMEDKIVGIENEDGSREDFVEKKLSDVVRKIRGPKATVVNLIVIPAEKKTEVVYDLTRERIELVADHAKWQVIEQPAEGRDAPVKIGVIRLPAFYGDTQAVMEHDPNAVSATADVQKALAEFKTKDVEAVIVDLRGNGGGLLTEAVQLSGLFIDTGPVVQVRQANGRRHLDDDDKGADWDGPLAVLIDKSSASASEIFAGVIKDYGRGLIIGDSSTFGKGTVQQILPLNEAIRGGQRLPNLGALKLTIQQFYRPNGESTQINGVKPDIHIPSPRDFADYGEGRSHSALEFHTVAALAHDLYNRVPADLVARIAKRSEERRESSPEFQEDARYIEKLVARKERHEISLNEDQFRAESRAREEEDESNPEDDAPVGRHSDTRAWDDSRHVNQEIARIVADYVTLGSQILLAAPTRVANPGEDLPPQLP